MFTFLSTYLFSYLLVTYSCLFDYSFIYQINYSFINSMRQRLRVVYCDRLTDWGLSLIYNWRLGVENNFTIRVEGENDFIVKKCW